MPRHVSGSYMTRVKEFIGSEAGPTATEYAVMLALIIIVALGAIAGLGTTVNSIFGHAEHQVWHTVN